MNLQLRFGKRMSPRVFVLTEKEQKKILAQENKKDDLYEEIAKCNEVIDEIVTAVCDRNGVSEEQLSAEGTGLQMSEDKQYLIFQEVVSLDDDNQATEDDVESGEL